MRFYRARLRLRLTPALSWTLVYARAVLRRFVLVALAACAGPPVDGPAAQTGPARVESAAGPAFDAPSGSAAQPGAVAPAPSSSADEGVLGGYGRHEWGIRRQDGLVLFEAPYEVGCSALPEKRPVDATIYLKRRGHEPTPSEVPLFGVAASAPCRFVWSMPWLEPPEASCRILPDASLDALWTKLRAARPHAIRMRALEGPAWHRGGWGLSIRYAGAECHIEDFGTSEIVDKDDARFRAAVAAVAEAHDGKSP